MTRYKEPRKLIRWESNPEHKVAKMLAWVVYDRERPSTATLARRVEELYEPVTRAVLGRPVTFAALRERTLQEMGADITPLKLMQRADKTDRYFEWHEYVTRVEVAYDTLHKATDTVSD